MFRFLLGLFLDMLMPPRHSARLVRALAPETLEALKQDGVLPYRNRAVRALVWELKYRANPHALALAAESISEELFAIATEEIGTPLLIPIPMHHARRKERGHNQTELLCEAALSRMKAVPLEYAPHALVRTRATPPQQGLPRRLRLTNLKNSMEVSDPEKIRGRVCIVLDDVTTTGATLAEAKRALKEAGARRVHTLALARS